MSTDVYQAKPTLRGIHAIFETSENWTIYREPSLTDQTFVDLCESISKTVSSVLDIDALNRAFASEQQADVKLAGLQAAVRAFVTDKFKIEVGGSHE